MNRDERALVDLALERARLSAFLPGDFVGQESFMRAGEILSLARRAGIAPGVSVLDLCCGVAGPGRMITRELGCTYLGVDSSVGAIEIARARGAGLDCRFEVARVPPVPPGPYDVVLLLETILAFPDKAGLLAQTAAVLAEGGRFAFTLEEGRPLSKAERASMPNADTVWLTPLPEIHASLDRAGLRVRWQAESSRSHQAVVDSLLNAFTADARHIAAHIGRAALDDLVTAHLLWSEWLREGRVRKFAFVVEKPKPAALGSRVSRLVTDRQCLLPLSGCDDGYLMAMSHQSTVDRLLKEHGETYAESAGIRLADKPSPLFQLLVLTQLSSTRISADIAVTAARELFEAGWRTPEKMRDATWQERVDALGRGHYRRYDESTSTKLEELSQRVLDEYGGDLRRMRPSGPDAAKDLARAVASFPRIGPTGARIFCREVQDVWPEVGPFFDDRALAAAARIGLPTDPEKLAALAPQGKVAVLAAALVRAKRQH